jgi:hypothetical protein
MALVSQITNEGIGIFDGPEACHLNLDATLAAFASQLGVIGQLSRSTRHLGKWVFGLTTC